MTTETREELFDLLCRTVRAKLASYSPETGYAPFHHRLLGRDRYAMFSFIQSMNTTFGMSMWEQIVVLLARGAGYEAERQFELLGEIDEGTERLIAEIHGELRRGKGDPSKDAQTERIRRAIKPGEARRHPDSVVDVFVKTGDGENYFDVTTVKPNIKEFSTLKLKLLRWIALRLSRGRNAVAYTRLAIPYNPYHPEPYERWTLRGMYDLDAGEILVGEDFWNFVAGGAVYEELLDVFQAAGDVLRPEIDATFARFRNGP